MNVGQLHAMLDAEGYSGYWIEGGHWGPRPDAEATKFLRWDLESGNYVLGQMQGGREQVTDSMASQDAACAAFYRMVTGEPAVGRSGDAKARGGGERRVDRSRSRTRDREPGAAVRSGQSPELR